MKNNLIIPLFADFIRIWKNNSSEEHTSDYKEYIKTNPMLDNILNNVPSFVYMLNYQTMKYVYISPSIKSVLGYSSDEIIPIGPQFFYEKIHPEDLLELMNITFKKITKYLYETKAEDRKKIRCSYDYRIKRSDGKYIRFLQQTVLLEMDKEGNPLLDIGMISEITDYKKENTISLLLSRYDENMGFSSENSESNIKKDKISERELEILKLLMKGNSSKQIADELHISSNTVRNHRQNLMAKTNTKNIAELITYAISNQMI